MNSHQNWDQEVPLMFQAPVSGRCQLQLIKTKAKRQQVDDWADEWTKPYPQPSDTKPESEEDQSNIPIWKRRPSPPKPNIAVQPPRFGKGVQTKEFSLDWRLVTNCGQDQIIRPVIGAKGYPYYPGSSMKGAFRRACDTDQQAIRYCGQKLSEEEDSTKPGILRFHGGYPTDNSWTQGLVDIIHSQQNKQVKNNATEGAKVQIALHQVKICFGISSVLPLKSTEWTTIWNIWQKALGYGLGSRVSAGYGLFQDVSQQDTFLQIGLKGQGIASTLINKTPEFRPNMFKATLRGHTLRLLGGITDADTAEQLTKVLWGGISDQDAQDATVGLLGVRFQYKTEDLVFPTHVYEIERNNKTTKISMPLYKLAAGTLSIFWMNQPHDFSSQEKQEVEKLASNLLNFSLLLGGFGKSWRRVDHRLFFPSYFSNGDKPMIGCHWESLDNVEGLVITKLEDITSFIEEVINNLRVWASRRLEITVNNPIADSWRESWYRDKVQVWGRIAKNAKDSQAVKWFHQSYQGTKSIQKTSLTGGLGNTGRIWHRMYPRPNNEGFFELLTIFPEDGLVTDKDFLFFLEKNSNFSQLW